jgi:hypothetical protein
MLDTIRLLRVAGACLVIAAVAPAYAENAVNLGPVKKFEPILTSIGEKRVVAFYEPEGINCLPYASIWKDVSAETESAIRVRVSLNPHQRIQVDGPDGKSLTLECGENGSTLAVIDDPALVASE